MTVTARAPGKLMLAGEYAILRPGGRAVAMAPARHVTVQAIPAEETTISSARLGWQARPAPAHAPVANPFLAAALAGARAVLAREGVEERGLRLTIGSTLPDSGMGSSAAVTVALQGAFLAAHDLDLTTEASRARLLGVALQSHLAAQGHRGSGYDVATAFHGGLCCLRAPANEPLAVAAQSTDPHRLGATLHCTRAPFPAELHVVWVASGRAAFTPALVSRGSGVDPTPLAEAAEAVERSFVRADASAVREALAQAQQAFESWDRAHALGLMVPELRTLANQARQAGLTPRVSGAGGGDGLLVLSEDQPALHAQAQQWHATGRTVLPITVDPNGLLVAGSDAAL